MPSITIRPIQKEEYPQLEGFLYLALFVHEGEAPFPRDITKKPELRIYYEDFGKEHDTCQVALSENGEIVGMAWARIMHDYGYVDDETPSLTIALLPEYRSLGIGTRLLESLLSELKQKGYRQASLSSQKENRSCHLYFREGFTVHHEDEEEYVMVKILS